MSFKTLCIYMFALTTTACAQLAPPSAPPPPQASLRQPCPNLPELTDGTGATVLRWVTGAAEQYRECQSRHGRLVEALK